MAKEEEGAVETLVVLRSFLLLRRGRGRRFEPCPRFILKRSLFVFLVSSCFRVTWSLAAAAAAMS